MSNHWKQFKALAVVCLFVIILEILLVSWTYNNGGHLDKRPQLGLDDLPRDTIHPSTLFHPKNISIDGILKFRHKEQIDAPDTISKKLMHGKAKNVSINAKRNKVKRIDRIRISQE